MSGLLLFHVPLGRSALGRIDRARTLCKRVATVHGGGPRPPRGPEPAVAVDQGTLAPHGEAFLSRTTACLCSSNPRRRFQTRHPDSGTPPRCGPPVQRGDRCTVRPRRPRLWSHDVVGRAGGSRIPPPWPAERVRGVHPADHCGRPLRGLCLHGVDATPPWLDRAKIDLGVAACGSSRLLSTPLGARRAQTAGCAPKCRLPCTKAWPRAQPCCIISRNGERFLQEEDSCCWDSARVSKGEERETRMQEATSRGPASHARRGDPDRAGVTARAVTAPARAGPEVVPRAGRAALHGRRATLRAGRPRLGPCLPLLQGALAVEPAYPLAVWVLTAGQRDFPRLLFRPAQPHCALADRALRLLYSFTLLGILRLIGDEATHLFANGADEECPMCPGALDEEASDAPLCHALRAIECPCRPGCCCPPLPTPTARQRLHRRAGDLRDEVGYHHAHLTHEHLTLVLASHHPCELLLPLPRQLGRRQQRRPQHREERDTLRRRHERFLLACDILSLEQRLDHGGTRRRGPQARVLHGEP